MEYRNARRSKKLIRDAFAELIKEKGNISKITVKEIIEKADISKSTFYAHYDDVYGVLEEFENELLNTINDSIDSYFTSKEKNFKLYTARLLALFQENDDLYHKLFNSDINSIFINKVKKMINKELIKYLPQKLRERDPSKFYFSLSFLTNGISEIIADYYKNNSELSLEQIREYTDELLQMIITYTKKAYNKLKKA